MEGGISANMNSDNDTKATKDTIMTEEPSTPGVQRPLEAACELEETERDKKYTGEGRMEVQTESQKGTHTHSHTHRIPQHLIHKFKHTCTLYTHMCICAHTHDYTYLYFYNSLNSTWVTPL